MALISSGGSKPPRLFTDANTGGPMKSLGGGHLKPVKLPKPKAAKPTKVAAPKVPGATPGAPAAGTDPTSDPFAFIQNLLTSTDPAAAQKLVDSVYGPQRDLINQQIQQLQASSQARAQQMAQIYQEFGQFIGPQLQQQMAGIYGPGSPSFTQGQQDGAALAKGMNGPVGNVGNELATVTGNGGSDLSSQLGSIYGNLAAKMPGIYSLYATQQIKQMLGAANANETTLRNDLLTLSSKEASDILSYLENAQSKDAQLNEWAYGQKQSQDQAAATLKYNTQVQTAKSQQAYLNYLQKQRQIDFNNAVVQGKLTLAQAKAQSDANYKAGLLQLKREGLITDAQYKAAQIQLGQGRLAVAQTNARTAAGRAAIAGAKVGATTVAGAQKGINTTLGALNKDVSKAKSPGGSGGTRNVYEIGSDGKPVLDKNGRPIKIGTKKVPAAARYKTPAARAALWNTMYKRYSRQLFSYYRTLYPNMAKQTGAIQKLVEQRITAAVGWGPNG